MVRTNKEEYPYSVDFYGYNNIIETPFKTKEKAFEFALEHGSRGMHCIVWDAQDTPIFEPLYPKRKEVKR